MKTLQKTIALVALATLIFSSNAFAQISATAPVSINLKKALTISNIGGSLAFGDVVVTGALQTESITNANGANFLVTGHPNKDVTITYSDVTLTNDAWNTTNGAVGNDATLTFAADMNHTGSTATWAAGTSVSTGGDTHALVNDAGTGKLYLWVGGDIDVAADQNHGDYVGTLTVEVAY